MDKARQRARDEWIALGCAAGDPRAFEEMVREMEGALVYYAGKLVGDESAALDVMQEVWIRAMRGVRKLKEPGALRGWLYQLTRGCSIDRVRRETVRERAEEGRAREWPEAREETEIGFEGVDAEAIHQGLDELSVEHRDVLVLHFLEDLSVAEIATVVGCAEGTVKSRMHYAKRALRDWLEEQRRPGSRADAKETADR